MKLFIASIFISTAALACPDLSGHYTTCKTSAGAAVDSIRDVGFTQQVMSGVNVYSLEYTEKDEQGNFNVVNDQFMADGLTREVDDDSGMHAKLVTNCVGNTLQASEELSQDGKVVATMGMNFSKTGDQLKVDMTIVTQGQTQKETLICQ